MSQPPIPPEARAPAFQPAPVVAGGAPPPAAGGIALKAGSTMVLLAYIATLLVFAVATLAIKPKFDRIFEDFAVELPAVTRAFYAVPAAAYTAAALLVIALLILKEAVIRNKGLTLALNALAMVMTFALVAFYVFAVFVPLVKLTTSLSN